MGFEGNSKDEVYWKILNTALYLDFKKGHLRWNISELSRAAGITRSLVYYYFGKSKQDILTAAVTMIGEVVYGLTEERLQTWKEGKIDEAVLFSRHLLDEHPAIAGFYWAHRYQSSEVGEAIRHLERQYVRKLKTFFPQAPRAGIDNLYSLFFGLVFTPGIADQSVREGVQAAVKIVRNLTATSDDEEPTSDS